MSHLVAPVDQTKAEFKKLINVIRKKLASDINLSSQHNFELVEALCKMRIESLNTLMRELIKEKKLSRSSRDISVQMLFFTTLLT